MQVTVVDYGIGNLFSVQRALEHCGASVRVSSDASAIETAERVVLPGVGAFADGMRGLRERGLVEPLRRLASAGRPLLGICLGMQMLADVSEEFGEHQGLGLIPGRVVAIPRVDVLGQPQKIPHIGWNALVPAHDAPGTSPWAGTILSSTPPQTSVYLVHSFHFVPASTADRLADCVYGGHRITAAVQRGRLTGCQFHPEKSGEAGLAVLRAFIGAAA